MTCQWHYQARILLVKFTDFINQLTESKDFETELVFEAEPSADNESSVAPRTITMSPADVYLMIGQPFPQVEGPGDRLTQPEGWFEPRVMEIGEGEGQVPAATAAAQQKWIDGGRMPGLLLDENGEVKPYDTNGALENLAWTAAGGIVQQASAVTKGTAKVADDVLGFVTNGAVEPIFLPATLASSSIDPETGKRVYDDMWMDDFESFLKDRTDQKFRDSVDSTAGAVNNLGDLALLMTGMSGANWEGVFGIMAEELPSEIVDVALMTMLSPIAGAAASTALNGMEAGGAAAAEIQKSIDSAYDDGRLQQQPQWAIALEAARTQLTNDGDGFTGSAEDLESAAENLAREQITHSAISNAFYMVAASGGVLDTVQNKILYGKSPIRPRNLGAALLKAVISPVTYTGKKLTGLAAEGVSEGVEQLLTNLGVMNAAGEITTAGEGVFNAAYNGIIAGNAAVATSMIADTIGTGDKAQKAGRAMYRQFFMGGETDVQSLINILEMDPNTLRQYAVDENGKLRLAELVKERGLKTTADVDPEVLARMNSTVGFYRQDDVEIDGVRYTLEDLEKNSRSIRLLELMDDVSIDTNENMAIVNFENEEDLRETAALLGLDSEGDLNDVMASLEDVRKFDARITGKSNLEAPVWTDLNARQQQEYISTGQIKFINDADRGNQTWSRDQVLFSSRQNNDSIPDNIANLVDNTDAFPTADNTGTTQELAMLQQQIDFSMGMTQARNQLETDQKSWDAKFSDTHNPDGSPKDPDGQPLGPDDSIDGANGARPSEDTPGDPYNFTGARAAVSAQTREQQILKDNLIGDQAFWEHEYGDTHNKSGVAKITQPVVGSGRGDGNIELDARDRDTVKTVTPPVVPNKDSAVALSKQLIASGTMSAREAEAYLKNLNAQYDGIISEILPNGVENINDDNLSEVEADLQQEDIVVPSPVLSGKPPKDSTTTFNGQEYKFQGQMWAPVKEDGSLGSTGHQNHDALTSQWQDENIDPTSQGTLVTPNKDGTTKERTLAPVVPMPDGSVDDGDNTDTDTGDWTPPAANTPPGDESPTVSTDTDQPVSPAVDDETSGVTGSEVDGEIDKTSADGPQVDLDPEQEFTPEPGPLEKGPDVMSDLEDGAKITYTDPTTGIALDGEYSGFEDGVLTIETPDGLQTIEVEGDPSDSIEITSPEDTEAQASTSQPTTPEVDDTSGMKDGPFADTTASATGPELVAPELDTEFDSPDGRPPEFDGGTPTLTEPSADDETSDVTGSEVDSEIDKTPADGPQVDLDPEQEFTPEPAPLEKGPVVMSDLEDGAKITYTDATTGITLDGEYNGFEDGVVTIKTPDGPQKIEIEGEPSDSITRTAPEPETTTRIEEPTAPEADDTSGQSFNPFNDTTNTTDGPEQLSVPKTDTEFTAPDVGTRTDIDTKSPELQTPELPTDASTPSTSEIDPNINITSPSKLGAPELDVSAPSIDTAISTPAVSTQGRGNADGNAEVAARKAKTVSDTAKAKADAQAQAELQKELDAEDTAMSQPVIPPSQTDTTALNDISKTVTQTAPVATTQSRVQITPDTKTDTKSNTTKNIAKAIGMGALAGIGSAAKKNLDFKAIQVYDPLQLKRSQQYIPGGKK